MTRKQIKNLTKELVRLELIHQNPSSSKEEIMQAEKRIMTITNRLIAEPDGLISMMEIDELVQKELNK